MRISRNPLSAAFRRAFALAVLASLAGCAGTAPAEQDEPTPRDRWRVGTAEHVALWYHGLAYVADDRADRVLPLFRPDYVDSMTAVKRREGAYPTPLDERADDFAALFAGAQAYAGLQFLPLYFRDADALFAAIDLWNRAGGDPRRAGSAQAAEIIAFLSNQFPRAEQRRAVTAWAELLSEEREAFYRAYWTARSAELESAVAAVQRDWVALAPRLEPFLDYMQLEGGDMLLVPALGAEGRLVARGPVPPRVALLAPRAARPQPAVYGFVHELLYPLVGEVIREYVAPVRIREIGEDVLATRAAVRGGAMLLERAAPDRAAAYRAYFLRAAGAGADAVDNGGTTAFEDAFPLPPELAGGIEEAVRQALAGI